MNEQAIGTVVLVLVIGLMSYWFGYARGSDDAIDPETAKDLTEALDRTTDALEEMRKSK